VGGVSGCGAYSSVDKDGRGGADGGGSGTVSFVGNIRAICGPADGPAVFLELWEGNALADCSRPAEIDHFRLFLHGRLPEAGTWSYTPDDGSADFCPAGVDGCLGWQGKLFFERYQEATEASGNLELWECDEGDCASVSGPFQLTWCPSDPEPMLCG